MSARGKLSRKDWWSAARHTVIPLAGGAAVAGLQALQSGASNLGQVKTAAVGSVLAGLIRLCQRWTTTLPG